MIGFSQTYCKIPLFIDSKVNGSEISISGNTVLNGHGCFIGSLPDVMTTIFLSPPNKCVNNEKNVYMTNAS